MCKKNCQHGIALVELMVGLVIGLLTTLAIAQVMTWAEGQRRSAMSGEDAQISGMLAIHALERSVRQAGYGLAANPAALGCPLNGDEYGGQTLPATLAPVLISDGAGTNGEDSIAVFESSKTGASMPLLVTEDHSASDTSHAFVVRSAFSASTGDYMVVVPQLWATGSAECTVFPVAGIYTAADAACTEGGGVACTKVGHAASITGFFPSSGYSAKSYLLNLGTTLRYQTYVIASNVLQITDLGSTARDAFPEIVNLQAFYAKDTDSDGTVDAYDTTTPTTANGWTQVIAVRLALVSRSTQYEREVVTAAAPEWDLGTALDISTTTVGCANGSGGKCVALPVSHLTDWQHYRYKVFDTMIPLRNSLWNS